MSAVPGDLPASCLDIDGSVKVDRSAVFALAIPSMANCGIQIILSLTDAAFVGHISTAALAGVAAVHWLVLAGVLFLGGAAVSIQVTVAQAFGSRRYVRAGEAAWIGLWATLVVAPAFIALGLSGPYLLRPFALDPQIQQVATQFWLPRLAGGFFSTAVWSMLGFFNGIGRPKVALWVTMVTTVANVVFNYIFIFNLDWGVAGSGIGTTVAQILGLAVALTVFLSPEYRSRYKSHLTWLPHRRPLSRQLKLGLPTGLLLATDLLGLSVFQMMQARFSAVAGAATQVAMMLTTIAYMPGYGLASAGTTLVGQSVGVGDRAWAVTVGSYVIFLTALFMMTIGLIVAFVAPVLLPLFTNAQDSEASAVVATGTRLLWLSAIYQFFDGMSMASGACLRGAGDVAVPAALVMPLSCVVFIPLAHALTFGPGEGWVQFLPAFGYGAVGGWSALVCYVMLLGMALFLRWHSGLWKRT